MSDQLQHGDVLEIPGVSIKPIVGAATSLTAFIGCTPSGEANKVNSIHGFVEFERLYGRPDPVLPLSYNVRQYFMNGGRHALIVRVADCLQSSIKPALQALLDYGAFNLLVIPETFDLDAGAARDVINQAIRVCEARQAFYLIDVPVLLQRSELQNWVHWLTPSCNATLYYPAIRISDPLIANGMRLIACSGTVAGVYARTDLANGVWMAPAGNHAMLIGAQGLTVTLTNSDHDELNRIAINTLRIFNGLGTVVWGSRTLSHDPEWKYIHVRRMALYIEASIKNSLLWVANEQNAEPLWEKISAAGQDFLQRLFQRGIFPAAKYQDACWVKCDRTTTSVQDQRNRKVNLEIGFALLKPAEFVTLRISMDTH